MDIERLSIFIFKASLDQRFCKVDSPTTDDDRAIDTINHPQAAEYGWIDVFSVDHVKATMIEKGELGDTLLTRDHSVILLSLRAMDSLQGLRLARSVRSLPATIVSRRGKILAEYVCLHATRRFDVLDYERSAISFFKTTGNPKSVSEYVLRADKMPDADLFLSEQSTWMVSEAFVERVQSQRLTGCTFQHIWGG